MLLREIVVAERFDGLAERALAAVDFARAPAGLLQFNLDFRNFCGTVCQDVFNLAAVSLAVERDVDGVYSCRCQRVEYGGLIGGVRLQECLVMPLK